MNLLKNKKLSFLSSSLVKNSGWGLLSNILQIIFVVGFFSIVARKFTTGEFAKFLIATTVYQIVAAFSSMGLGQWFIRQYAIESDKFDIISKYLKTQSILGIAFYVVNVAFAYALYSDHGIRMLCVVLGLNIIFDNLISAIKSLNIAEYQQNKTAPILLIDGFLKLIIGLVLLTLSFSPVVLAMLLIVARVFTIGLFVKIGTSGTINLRKLWVANIYLKDLKLLILNNWQFMVIGSVSIIYWRMGNIIISKTLSLTNIAEYEIAFRVFSLLQIVPLVVSSTIYPQLVKYFNAKNYTELKYFYNNIFLMATLFSIVCYAFTYSFSGIIIPLAFGKGYPGAVLCLQQMSLSLLFIPTVLLQANLIVAINLEKLDMWFNISSLFVYVLLCIIGLHFYKSLSVVNYAILVSFFVFHFSQDVILVNKKFSSILNCILFYVTLAIVIIGYQFIAGYLNPYLSFSILIAVLTGALLLTLKIRKKAHMDKQTLTVV